MKYIFDIDNTIYHRDDEQLSDDIFKSLSKLCEVGDVYFATRRENFILNPILGLEYKNIIVANGAYDLNGELLCRSILNFKEILEYLDHLPYVAIGPDGIVCNNIEAFGSFCGFYNNQFIDEPQTVTSIAFISKRDMDIERYFLENDLSFVYVENYENYIVQVSGVNKHSSIEMLKFDEYIAFGDDIDDDLPMLQAAKVGYLIGNNNQVDVVQIEKEEIVDVLNMYIEKELNASNSSDCI